MRWTLARDRDVAEAGSGHSAETAADSVGKRASRISHAAIRLQLLQDATGGQLARLSCLSCSCTKMHTHPLSHLPPPRLPSAPLPPVNLLSEAAGQKEGRSPSEPIRTLGAAGPALGRPEDGGDKTGPWGGFRTVAGNSRPLSHGGVQKANYGSMASPHPRGLCHEGRRSCGADADLFVVSPGVMLGLHGRFAA